MDHGSHRKTVKRCQQQEIQLQDWYEWQFIDHAQQSPADELKHDISKEEFWAKYSAEGNTPEQVKGNELG